ncbi:MULTISPECIES: class F sortase [Streptomyces]|uniref:class F sortase n=1 Tax=Streptomyces TaxID=1883 RepID=UPI002248AE55|nr:class F sortase [Streptomyces sp. JHD 1]MCX2971091.1 class F sortase [Streptomyces sp. JHD 1]
MSGEGSAPGTGRLVTATAWTVLLLALWLWGKDLTDGALPQPARGAATAERAGDGRPLPPARAPLADAGPPRHLAIAEIGVDADVVGRGLDADGAVDPPPMSRAETVGWYTGGASPGEEGTAVLVGHVDTETERAVFYELSTLRPGAEVAVTRADGSLAAFTVEDVEVVERDSFDADRVYGQRHAGRAELRLITCGGSYDEEADSYTANVVVSAYLSGTGEA